MTYDEVELPDEGGLEDLGLDASVPLLDPLQ